MAIAYVAPTGTGIDLGGRASRRSARSTAATAQRASSSSGIRLTRRGRLALVALAALAVVALGPLRAVASSPEGSIPEGWTVVTVAPGDTLWGIAQATGADDPRPVIAEIREVNHLASSAVLAGQELAVPAS